NASTRPKLEVSYKEKNVDRPTRISRELTRIDTTPAVVSRAVARIDRVSEIGLEVEAKDDREAARAVDALDALARLHAAGLDKAGSSFEQVDRLAGGVGVKDARARGVVKSPGASPPSNVRPSPVPGAGPASRGATSGGSARAGLPLVAWDHIISPDES